MCFILYITRDVNNDYTDHKSSSSSGGRLGSGGMLGDEGMFVFQTKSASAMSRTIEYRAKEIAKKGQHKTTCEFWILMSNSSNNVDEIHMMRQS